MSTEINLETEIFVSVLCEIYHIIFEKSIFGNPIIFYFFPPKIFFVSLNFVVICPDNIGERCLVLDDNNWY